MILDVGRNCRMKRHKDYYEYKTISFHFFKKVANKNEFKKEWGSVKWRENIMKKQSQNDE